VSQRERIEEELREVRTGEAMIGRIPGREIATVVIDYESGKLSPNPTNSTISNRFCVNLG
jgi:hypothetical protein